MRDVERTAAVGWEQESRERRASHRQTSAEMLDIHKISYESKNSGSHLVIALPDRVIDFWPGTGLFTDRKTKSNGRGVRNLIKKIGRINEKAKPGQPSPPVDER